MHTARVDPAPTLALALLCGAFALVAGSVLANDGSLVTTAMAAVLAATAALVQVRVIPWRTLVAAIVLVVLFIPIRRYVIGIDGPFQLEPYRLLLALVLCGWLASLLVNPHVRFARTGLEGPLSLILIATFLSVIANWRRVSALDTEVVKSLVFFLSFVLLLYLLVSVVRVRRDIDFILRVLVGGGVVIAVLAVIEARTGFTPFNSLSTYLPFMDMNPEFEPALMRGARTRAFGSAEHPIALGAALAMLVPLSIYLSRVQRPWIWGSAAAVLAIGSLSTVSRTVVMMLAAMALVAFVLRPRQVARMWPLLIAIVVTTHFAAPGTLGTLQASFAPEGGLVAEQQKSPGSVGSGRIADLGPSLDEWSEQPFFGQGFGTRITTGATANASILDNQWLGTLLELGLVGFVAWIWLFVRVIRRAGVAARRDRTSRGDLLIALTASIVSYPVGMLTFDAFSFIQVTLLMFLLLGLLVVAIASEFAFGAASSRVPSSRLTLRGSPAPGAV